MGRAGRPRPYRLGGGKFLEVAADRPFAAVELFCDLVDGEALGVEGVDFESH
jgi:hypothetical protein